MKGSTGTAGRLINEGVLSHNRAAVLKEASEIRAKALKICWRCQGERPVAEGREEQLGPGLRRFTCVSCLPPGTDLRPKTRVLKEAASLRRLEKEKVRILKEATLGATRKQREETQARLKRKLEERKKAEAAARRAEKARLRDERDAVTRKEREEIKEAGRRLAQKVLDSRPPLSFAQQFAREFREDRASVIRRAGVTQRSGPEHFESFPPDWVERFSMPPPPPGAPPVHDPLARQPEFAGVRRRTPEEVAALKAAEAKPKRKRKTPEDRQRELEAEADRQYYEGEDFPDLLE